MQILPVLDLLNGVVVRGVAGRREEYRPVQSSLTPSCQPLEVALAFRERLGLTTLYVADLDAILHRQPNFAIYRQLAEDGFRLLIDAGLRDTATATELLALGCEAAIVALETFVEPKQLAELVRTVGAERLIFSLDLRDGQPVASTEKWPAKPLDIAALTIERGVRRMIVLDVSSVGVGNGVPTEDLCRVLKSQYPDLRLITGGGVRGVEDLRRLQQLGVEAALVASALHDGRIGPRELASLKKREERG